MTDLSMVSAENDDLAMDEATMPGTFAGPAPVRPLAFGTVRTGDVGETGGSPEKVKVFDPKLFDERLQQRVALQSEGLAREVFAQDVSKAARAGRLARKYGLDPSQVTPNLDEFEIKDLAERFQGAPPKVRNWLGQDQLNALLGYQDIENLSSLERIGQNLFEFGKGVPKGVGSLAGTAMVGAGVNAAAFGRAQISIMDRIDAGETIKPEDDPLGYADMNAEQRAEVRQVMQRQAAVPLTQLPLVTAGRALPGQTDIFPAAKGFEDSIGRQLGEGFGTLGAGVVVSVLTGMGGSGAVFALSGSGEAVQRAIDAGASEDEIIAAARLGVLPGLTDSLPIETLLGRVPIPGGRILKVPAGMLGSALRGVGRIGWQAFIEGAQEGGQAFLQNLIAREVYKPDQSLTEGLPGDAGLGAGVGGIAQVAKEAVGLIGGRRARSMPFAVAKEIDAETQAAQAAQNAAQGLTDAMERVQASPVSKNDPDAMKALLTQIAGQDGAVYMPGSEALRLYQDGTITDDTLKGWGVLDQMMEVRATGGDLVIPAANFLASNVAAKAIPEVARSVRLRADAMTAIEAEAFQQDRQQRVAEVLERMSLAGQDRPDGSLAYDAVYNGLVASGTAAADARAYAALTVDRYQRRAADRLGVTADELFVRDNFKVIGPGLEAGIRKIVRDEIDVVIARLQSGRQVKTPKTPVLDLLKRRGGVDPSSPLGAELRNMGITAKSNPGLFKTSGLKAADNIVASEETVLTDNGVEVDENGYAAPEALMAGVREEIAGRPWQTQAEKDRIAQLDAPVAELQKIMDKAGFDYRNASPEAIRAFLETQLQPEPVVEGKNETTLDQAFRPKAFVEFGRKVADALAGKLRVGEILNLGRTPEVLRLVGAPDAPLVMAARVAVKAASGKHSVALGVLQQMGDLIQRPVAVFDSGTDGGLVVLLDEVDAGGDPIIAAIHLADGKQALNRIASVYGKGRDKWFAEQVSAGRLRYVDQEKSQRWSARTGVQFPGGGHLSGFAATGKEKVFTEVDLVKGEKTVLNQPDGSTGFKRGSFERQRDPHGDIINIIRLTKNANRSTFLHETGHFWYFQLVEDAFDPGVRDDARARLQADLQTTLDWFGINLDVKTSTPEAILAATTVEHHEQFARGAEAYFMEGKAPSLELKKLFAKFSGWLISIYKKLRALNVELTDDVRSVFDNLLATEEAIQEARDKRMYAVPAELAETLTLAERANLEKVAEQAVIEARMELQGKVAKEIQREKTDEWKAEKRAVTEELTAAIRRRPLYAALNLLRDSTNPGGEKVTNEDGSERNFKLNRKELTDRYGEEIVSLLPSGIWARNGYPSVSLDVMAGITGFDSADALKVALMEAKANPERSVIKAEVEAELKRRHGDLMANIEEEASEAVANDKQMELMALQARHIKRLARDKMSQAAKRRATQEGAAPLSEMREGTAQAAMTTDAIERTGAPAEAALGAQVAEEFARTAQSAQSSQRAAQSAAAATVSRLGPDADQVGVIKEAAAQFVREKTIKLLGTPERYEMQAMRLSRELNKAIAKRDYAKAAVLTEQRLSNFQIAREVRKVEQQIEKARVYLDKFSEKKTRQAMGKAGADYLERIDALLEQYELRRTSNRELDRRTALAAWLADQAEQGVEPEIPASVLERSKIVNYREVKVSEFLDLRDAVKSIEHVARFKNKLMREEEKRTMQELEDAAVASIEANVPPLPPNFNPQRDGFGSNFAKEFANYASLLTKAQTWFAKMDGKEGTGFFFTTVLAPLRRAEIARLQRLQKEGKRFEGIVKKHYGSKPKWESSASKVFIPEIGQSLTLGERLSVALNWGNEGNIEALLNDKSEARKGWGLAGYQAIVDTLAKRDLDFVQDTRDYIDSFWDEIAKLQKKRTGLAPEKVEATPMQTRFGTYRGGYYPLQYDPNMQVRTKEQTHEELFAGFLSGRMAAASTKRGHTIGRTGSGGQSPMLSMDVISRHVAQVVTDLTMGEAITDAWKILNREKIKDAIQRHMGMDVVNGLEMWIKDTAVGQISAADAFSKRMRGLRTSVSAAAMGWKLGTTLMQVSGFTQTAVQVGKGNMLAGLAKFIANPIAAHRQVMALSPFMQERTSTFQRDIADALSQAKGAGGIRGKALQTWFWPIAKMQQMVDIPTWIAGYSKAVKQGLTGQAAVDYADNTVIGAQSSSLMSELSAFERGSLSADKRLSEAVKLWGTFYSYFNTKLNLAMRRTQATNFRNPLQVVELIADYAMIFWFEAVVTEVIRNLPDWFDDDTDKEERTFWQVVGYHLGLTVGNVLGTVPLMREIWAGLQGFDAAPGVSRGLSELVRGGGQAGKAVVAAFDEDEDVNWWSAARAGVAAGNVLSPVKYPAGQINNVITGAERASNRDDVGLLDFLIAKPK